MKKKSIVIIVGLAVLVGAGAWLAGRDKQADAGERQGAAAGEQSGKSDAKGGNGGAQPPAIVNVVSPQRQDVPVVLQANASVTPVSTVDLHPQTTSTIRKVHIKEGQFVKAGELMFSLDDRSERANIDKARAQMARDAASAADLERQYKRSEELFAQKFIARSAVDTLKSQLDSARALVGAGQAALQAEQVNASYSAIRAPMAGRVGAINVFPGSLVQLATSLTTITQLDPINIAFNVPESALGDLLAAQKNDAVMVDALAGPQAKALSGKLSFIDNAVDPLAGSIKVKALFDNKDASLWPGQYVSARVTVQTIKNAVVIPQAAIISNTRGTFVYVVDADHSAKQMPVVRLHAFGVNAAVSGLNGDEKVITEGKQNLRPGGKVRLADASGPKSDAKTAVAAQ
ncbi:efflux RND transporter periplasmic adaptor subunit [Massilia sp. CCM 8734]|uniref:efflux RND transporter periplasmic adaptor subunit n=1 Tax=Massilia sp. CCM 8734 TaxID=2609283 RepID=UPI00141EA893|nr:efflux RND transporter periplasmic adaptor subunit [Massilia sp. CCM 8734]NHZ99863.1 efflux RND transporter periplasmic adaptor subunit [Massilia sp. CCM 8734]